MRTSAFTRCLYVICTGALAYVLLAAVMQKAALAAPLQAKPRGDVPALIQELVNDVDLSSLRGRGGTLENPFSYVEPLPFSVILWDESGRERSNGRHAPRKAVIK